jgi:hypothetical protein
MCDENSQWLRPCSRQSLQRCCWLRLRHRYLLNIVIEGAMDMAAGMADGGTGEPEPLWVSVLGSGSLVGLWQLLPTTRLRITEHPVMATPPLQPSRQRGTGVIHTSNITHMCQIARLRGGKSCNEMWSGGVRAVSRPAPLSVASPRTLRLCAVGSRSRCSFVIPASSTRNPGLPNLLDFQGAHWQRT